MTRLLFSFFFLVSAMGMSAQGMVRGLVADKQTDEVLQFVNVRVME